MSNCSNCNHEFEFDEQYNSDGSSIESVITCVICLKKLCNHCKIMLDICDICNINTCHACCSCNMSSVTNKELYFINVKKCVTCANKYSSDYYDCTENTCAICGLLCVNLNCISCNIKKENECLNCKDTFEINYCYSCL